MENKKKKNAPPARKSGSAGVDADSKRGFEPSRKPSESFRSDTDEGEGATYGKRGNRRRGDRNRGSSYSSGSLDRTGCNDPRWYGATPQLVKDFASFPYGVPTGDRFNTGDSTIDSYSIPGIMRVSFVPAIGYADEENSAINIAMRQIYTYVRKKNSGAANYEAPDLMKYIISMDSCYMYLAWMRRLYGLMLDYSYVNRYWPEAIILAMGVNPASLRQNMAAFRGFINIFAAKVSSMCIPATMPYMLRHTWMVTNVYADSNQEKAQLYFYEPVGYYQYAEGTTPSGKSLVRMVPAPGTTNAAAAGTDCWIKANPVNSASSLADLDALIEFGQSLIDPLIGSQDSNNMSGDILKAFEGNIVKAFGVTDDYKVMPQFNEEVLSQIMNSTAVGWFNFTTLNIQENTGINEGWLSSTPSAIAANVGNSSNETIANGYMALLESWLDQSATGGNIDASLTANRLITFNKGDITPDDTMVATRLTNTYDSVRALTRTVTTAGSSTVQYYVQLAGVIKSLGSEAVQTFDICYYSWVNNTRQLNIQLQLSTDLTLLNLGATANVGSVSANMMDAFRNTLMRLMQLQNFDWHPPVYAAIAAGQCTSSGTVVPNTSYAREIPAIAQDLGNFTTLSNRNLQDLAKVALLSEFYVPSVGTMDIGLE